MDTASTRKAIKILTEARESGVVDVRNPAELQQTAERWGVTPDELVDCVMNVGNSVVMLRAFLGLT